MASRLSIRSSTEGSGISLGFLLFGITLGGFALFGALFIFLFLDFFKDRR